MKNGVYGLLKAKYLVDQGSAGNWRFIVFLILVAMLMIANSHNYEQKIYRIGELEAEIKLLRSQFVDKKSELMGLRMESTVAKKMEEREIFPSKMPPKKIKVTEQEEKDFWERLWQ
jgi:hypothetical protein